MRNRSASALPIALCAVLLLLLTVAPRSEAQVRAAGVSVGHGPASGMGRGFGVAVSRTPGMERFHRSPIFLGSPYFYSDYPTEPVVQETPPQVVVVQAPAATEHVKVATIEPLMIEWQEDHYARLSVSQEAAANTKPVRLDYVETHARPALTLTRSALAQSGHAEDAAPALPPVVLVYRDGHHEEIRDYTIVDGTIYARGDYWTDGYWNKKIQLAALDLPATAKASQADGAKFVLPSSPNEVVTRF